MSRRIATFLLVLLALDPASAGIMARKDRELEFKYAWPAMRSLPRLDAVLRGRATTSLASARHEAIDLWRHNEDPGQDPPRHSYAAEWSQTGSTKHLLALRGDTQFYTGGAHEGIAYDALLWDRKRDRRLRLRDIFTAPGAALAMMEKDYCAQLRRDQAERRGEALSESEFRCPAIQSQPVVLTGTGRITGYAVLLQPYAAGSWAEGPYEVELRLRPSLLRLVKAEFRESFR